MARKIIGIDLGTTNSVVAILEGATPTIVPNAEGLRTTPSVVAFHRTDKTMMVGYMAKRQAVVNPENTFSSIKRFMGAKYSEVREDIKLVSYEVKPEGTGRIKVHCPILEKDFSPEEISSFILKKLAEDAGKYLNTKVNQAVITVPAYFNDSQRVATKDAGNIAGLEVLRILNEPTAAALSYGLDKKKNEVVLIFDLGGGTFDVSVLEVGEEVFEVLATSGDTHLGGNDWDQRIYNYILDTFEEKTGVRLSEDKTVLQRILEASEKAKVELSFVPSVVIDVPFVGIKDGVPLAINMTLSRNEFERISQDLFERCKVPLRKALEDAKLSKGDIDEVILVGGSTRIPGVRNLIKNVLGKPLNETVNPDEVVALGAAIQAGIVAGEITDLILLDVTPLSLGVATMGGIMTRLIERNSSIPVKQSEVFSTAVDDQDSVEINVLQGERPMVKDNKSLGVFVLSGIPPAPRGVPQVNVTFNLDSNGVLSVSAREQRSGVEQSIEIQNASVLDRDQVARMVQEAEENLEDDSIDESGISLTYLVDDFLYEYDIIEEILIDLNATNLKIGRTLKKLVNAIIALYEKMEISKMEELEILSMMEYSLLAFSIIKALIDSDRYPAFELED